MSRQLNPKPGRRLGPPASTPGRELGLSRVARAAAEGDEAAWTQLVQRLDGALRAVARRYRLTPSDVEDVVQTTWLRAVVHVHRMDDPAAIAAWLIVTARREAMRTLQRGVRELVGDDPAMFDDVDPMSPEALAIERERRAAVHDAVERLRGRQRRLLSWILVGRALTYEQLSSLLNMPVGSIGPTRDRALARMRVDAELGRALTA